MLSLLAATVACNCWCHSLTSATRKEPADAQNSGCQGHVIILGIHWWRMLWYMADYRCFQHCPSWQVMHRVSHASLWMGPQSFSVTWSYHSHIHINVYIQACRLACCIGSDMNFANTYLMTSVGRKEQNILTFASPADVNCPQCHAFLSDSHTAAIAVKWQAIWSLYEEANVLHPTK